MKPIKSIEVILPEAILQPFTDLIETHEFEAYTVKTGLSGKNRKGIASAGLCDASVSILCDQNDADRLIPAISNFLSHFGGIGYIIEAQALMISRVRNAT